MEKKTTNLKEEGKKKTPLKRIKTILISQPEPVGGYSPFLELEDKYKVGLTFRPFIRVEGVTTKEFRKERVNLSEHTAVVFTSRTAIENFFRISEETRAEISEDMKYFCVTESIALYLQKFVTYRKRKVFFPKTRDKTLKDYLHKHKKEKFLFPRSNICKNELRYYLQKNGYDFTPVVLYKTLSSDLSDLEDLKFDIICFFSPSGIKSLFENFPDFEQNETLIAAFGPATGEAVVNHGLRLDIKAPAPQAPSMKMALEAYLKKSNK